MRSSVDGPPSPCGHGLSSGRNNTSSSSNNNNNNNNSSNNENSDNSGCQYALCALGVGLVALGIVMVVWSVVPADASQNSSSIVGGGGGNTGKKNKVSSVAFVLVGCGILMLLLSLGLGMRIKQRRLREARRHGGEAGRVQEEAETAEEQAQRYAVPTYEEAVGSGQYPVRQSNHRPSASQLPSYDDLLQVDGVEYEDEAPQTANAESQQAPTSTANHRPGKNSRKLLPLNIRRIKSEKFHWKNNENSQPAAGLSIEPLTPPPQYEDKVPPL